MPKRTLSAIPGQLPSTALRPYTSQMHSPHRRCTLGTTNVSSGTLLNTICTCTFCAPSHTGFVLHCQPVSPIFIPSVSLITHQVPPTHPHISTLPRPLPDPGLYHIHPTFANGDEEWARPYYQRGTATSFFFLHRDVPRRFWEYAQCLGNLQVHWYE